MQEDEHEKTDEIQKFKLIDDEPKETAPEKSEGHDPYNNAPDTDKPD